MNVHTYIYTYIHTHTYTHAHIYIHRMAVVLAWLVAVFFLQDLTVSDPEVFQCALLKEPYVHSKDPY